MDSDYKQDIYKTELIKKQNQKEGYLDRAYLNIEPNIFSEKFKTNINRKDIEFTNNLLFMLENFLTDSQSEFLIEKIEKLKFQDIDWEYPSDYRSCKRKIVFSDDLSCFLWKKLVNNLNWEDLQHVSPFGFEKEGKWFAHNINPCLRFTKYEKGNFFKKHLDGQHVQNENERSILTLMIYLNDNFKGGETIFYENQMEITIQPKKNLALIFNHDIYHEGKDIEEGYKYILRTDVLFKRYKINILNTFLHNPFKIVDEEKANEISKEDNIDIKNSIEISVKPKLDCEHELSEKLFYESVDLQIQGNPRLSTEKYLEAQKIQSKYSTYMNRKLHQHKANCFPENQNFNKLATPVYLEKIQQYLFDLNILIANSNYNKIPYHDYYHFYGSSTFKMKAMPTKVIDMAKLKEILTLRMITRKFNKYFSGNFLWNKILGFNFPKKLFGINRDEMPNDTHNLEIFKLKCLEFKKNLNVYIDISNKYIRTAFNLPILNKSSFLFKKNLPFNELNGKIESYVNYFGGHLWGSRSGFNYVLGRDIRIGSYNNYDIGKVFNKKDGKIDYKRIIDIYTLIKNHDSILEFSISLPYFMFMNFDYSNEKYIELIDVNNNEYQQKFNIEELQFEQGYIYKNLPINYFLELKKTTYVFENGNRNIQEENDLRKILNEKLINSEDLPSHKLLESFKCQKYDGLFDGLKTCICRERLFYQNLKMKDGVVVFLDDIISTYTYFIYNRIQRDLCFTFSEDEMKTSPEEIKKKFNQNFKMVFEFRKYNDRIDKASLNMIIVYEANQYLEFFEGIKSSEENNIDIKIQYFQYDEIYNLGKDII